MRRLLVSLVRKHGIWTSQVIYSKGETFLATMISQSRGGTNHLSPKLDSARHFVWLTPWGFLVSDTILILDGLSSVWLPQSLTHLLRTQVSAYLAPHMLFCRSNSGFVTVIVSLFIFFSCSNLCVCRLLPKLMSKQN